MVDTKTPGDKTLSVPTKTLTLKPRVERGTVRQSFSHGRTKSVVVEKRGKRRVGGDLPASEPAPAPEPTAAKAAPARAPLSRPSAPAAPRRASGVVLPTLTEDDRSARASALARAVRSSSVSVRNTTPEFLRGAAGAAGRDSGALACAALATTGSGAGGASAVGMSPPMRRLPRFSTTTCLVRPWLKLWRTVPCSTRGLSVKVLVGTLSVLSPGVFVSTIQQSQSCYVVRVRTVLSANAFSQLVRGRCAAGIAVVRQPVLDQNLAARQERLARRAREQGSMYHI